MEGEPFQDFGTADQPPDSEGKAQGRSNYVRKELPTFIRYYLIRSDEAAAPLKSVLNHIINNPPMAYSHPQLLDCIDHIYLWRESL